jgi:hypothetical protein
MTTLFGIFVVGFLCYIALRLYQGHRESVELLRQRDEAALLRSQAAADAARREAELTALHEELNKLRDRVPGLEPEDPTKAPWASIRAFSTQGDTATMGGATNVYFVSRHDIAECGLWCPRCKTMVCKRGDYSLVRRTYINGTENEVVKCTGVMLFGSQELACPLWLAASPDTEHGDHLKEDGTVDIVGDRDPPEFYQFRRVTKAQALQEELGMDVAPGAENGDIVINPKTKLPVAYGEKYSEVLVGNELAAAIHAAAGLKTVLPPGAPPASAPPEEPPPPPKPIDPDATPPHPAPVIA